jgi:preprotein translocase subunit SecA
MGITDIKEKEAEERKREKRLIHFINTVSKDFIEAKKPKTKNEKELIDYTIKSLLDYLFFNRHKEIGELNDEHLRYFLIEYAPQKLAIKKESSKEVIEIIESFLEFLDNEGYIRNGSQLKNVLGENVREFTKLLPAGKTSPKKLQIKEKRDVAIETVKIGRNDPCPCGSGKKYKKCCGKE